MSTTITDTTVNPADCAGPPIPQWALDALPAELAQASQDARGYLRPPADVLVQRRLRGMAATRLSFAQSIVRRMVENSWDIRLAVCEIAPDSTGFLGYEIEAEGTRLSFGVFVYQPFDLNGPPRLFRDMKTETLGILMFGPLDRARLVRERAQFDEQVWRGRSDSQVIAWTIAGRGTRTFDFVTEALGAGQQPAATVIDDNGGYIMRNGGFYGNGRMGTAAWTTFAEVAPALSEPYHVDLFALYLWRLVSFDLVEATARARSDAAVALTPQLKRHIGIGNSSGMGTVAALLRWPGRTAGFVLGRELAYAYATSRPLEPEQRIGLAGALDNAAQAYDRAPTAAEELIEPRHQVSSALRRMRDRLVDGSDGPGLGTDWSQFFTIAEAFGSVEAVEIAHGLLLEQYPETQQYEAVVEAGKRLQPQVDPVMTIEELRSIIETDFSWVLNADLEAPGAREYFWYRSEENGENRRGERSIDLGVERETFIDVAGHVKRLWEFLRTEPEARSVAEFLIDNPEHTQTVIRVQFGQGGPYSEICESVTSTNFLPSNAIRGFLSILGIELPTPHSGRWVRGLFYRGAPLPDDLRHGRQEPWGIGASPYDDARGGSR